MQSKSITNPTPRELRYAKRLKRQAIEEDQSKKYKEVKTATQSREDKVTSVVAEKLNQIEGASQGSISPESLEAQGDLMHPVLNRNKTSKSMQDVIANSAVVSKEDRSSKRNIEVKIGRHPTEDKVTEAAAVPLRVMGGPGSAFCRVKPIALTPKRLLEQTFSHLQLEFMRGEIFKSLRFAIQIFLKEVDDNVVEASLTINSPEIDWHQLLTHFSESEFASSCTNDQAMQIAKCFSNDLYLTYRFLRLWCSTVVSDDGSVRHLDPEMVSCLYKVGDSVDLLSIFNFLQEGKSTASISDFLKVEEKDVRLIVEEVFPMYAADLKTEDTPEQKQAFVEQIKRSVTPSLKASELNIEGLTQKKLRYLLVAECGCSTLSRCALSKRSHENKAEDKQILDHIRA